VKISISVKKSKNESFGGVRGRWQEKKAHDSFRRNACRSLERKTEAEEKEEDGAKAQGTIKGNTRLPGKSVGFLIPHSRHQVEKRRTANTTDRGLALFEAYEIGEGELKRGGGRGLTLLMADQLLPGDRDRLSFSRIKEKENGTEGGGRTLVDRGLRGVGNAGKK